MAFELVAALKGLSTVVGYVRTAGTVRSWLAREPESPLALAVASTAKHFESRYSNITEQLRAFLGADSTQQALQALASEPTPDLAPLAREYVRITDLYVGPGQPAESAATEILLHLLQELDEQLLAAKTAVAITHHERKDEARHSQVQEYFSESEARDKAIQDQLSKMAAALSQVASSVAEQPEQQVSRFKELHKDDPLPDAKIAWKVFEQSTQGAGWTSRARAEVSLERASVALQLGDLSDATRLFREAYAQDPTHPRAQRNRALGLALENDVTAALAASDDFSSREPSNDLFVTTRAQILHLAGRDAEVVALLDRRIEAGAATSDHRRLLAASLVRLKRFDEAITIADVLAHEDPVLGSYATQALAYGARAEHSIHEAQFDTKVNADLENAASAFARCIPLARTVGKTRELVEYLVARSNALMALDRSDEAREQALEALRLEPESRQVALTAANASLLSGRPELALTAAEPLARTQDHEAVAISVAAYARVNTNSTYRELVEYARRYGGLERASHLAIEVLVQKAIDSDAVFEAEQLLASWEGPDLKRRLMRARILVARHDRQGALQVLTETIALSPTLPDLFTIARLAATLEDVDLSLRAYGLLHITAATPAFILGTYLNALFARRTPEDEETILRLASDARVQGVVALPLLHSEAAVRESRHDITGARADWLELAQRVPADARYQLAVAKCDYRLGNVGSAKAILDALDRDGLGADELLLVAELDRRVGEPRRAIRTGYLAWKKGRQSAEVLYRYATLFFMIPEGTPVGRGPLPLRDPVFHDPRARQAVARCKRGSGKRRREADFLDRRRAFYVRWALR